MKIRTLLLILASLLAAGSPALSAAGAQTPVSDAPARRLAGVKSWAYQLQKASPAEIAASPFDVVVIDMTRNGDPKKPYKAAEIARMKKKPDGSRRIVLAYMSIGEAEDYRFYWNEEWTETPTAEDLAEAAAKEQAAAAGGADANTSPPPQPPLTAAPIAAPQSPPKVPETSPMPGAVPALPPGTAPPPEKPVRWLTDKAPPWLGDENEAWSGNFAVHYWDADWQALIFGGPKSYLSRIIDAGFDGVYLDRTDAYYEYQHERPSADEDMAQFVIALAADARKRKSDFIVVPQNAEELLLKPHYVATIDAIAKEDLFYGHPDEGQPNPERQINNSLGWLQPAVDAGKPVLVIEYLDKPEPILTAKALIEAKGFVPYFGPRTLDNLVKQSFKAPGSEPPAAPARKRRAG